MDGARPRRSSTGPEGADFQEALRRFLLSRPDGAHFYLAGLWKAWPEIMGETLAGLALPLGVENRVLVIGAEDNAALYELSFQTPRILELANGFLKTPYFTRIRLEPLQGRQPLAR